MRGQGQLVTGRPQCPHTTDKTSHDRVLETPRYRRYEEAHCITDVQRFGPEMLGLLPDRGTEALPVSDVTKSGLPDLDSAPAVPAHQESQIIVVQLVGP